MGSTTTTGDTSWSDESDPPQANKNKLKKITNKGWAN
jgi:hypothetical protein